eukprot:jgi/Picre1/30401/NNA_005765.t1
MGNQQSRGTTFGTFQIENLIGELPHVVYKGPLGEHGRFFKTSMCATLSKGLDGEEREEKDTKKGAHVWSHEQIIQTPQAVHIVRQYFWSSLAQRMTSRPFLTMSEKLWIGYQVLRGVEQAHACHWKEEMLSCSERFVKGDVGGSNELKPEMDVFSAGCVLAELFSDGASVFEYSDVLELARSREYPSGFFEAIDDRVVGCVRRMIDIDPKQRPTASECVAMFVAHDDVGSSGVALLDRVSERLLVENPESRARAAEECFHSMIMPLSEDDRGNDE